MNNGNESRLVFEGKECIILWNDSFRKCAEDSGRWLRIRACAWIFGKTFLMQECSDRNGSGGVVRTSGRKAKGLQKGPTPG